MEKVPSGAPFHSWNVGVPKFEFGMMHAILFQLAVLPLTMCRLSIASLSDTFLCRFLPFNRMTDYHIAIGYTLVIFLLATVSIFFMFFGVICNSGDDSFCRKVWYNKFSNVNFRFTLHSLTCYFHVVHNRNHDHRLRRICIFLGCGNHLFFTLQDQIQGILRCSSHSFHRLHHHNYAHDWCCWEEERRAQPGLQVVFCLDPSIHLWSCGNVLTPQVLYHCKPYFCNWYYRYFWKRKISHLENKEAWVIS